MRATALFRMFLVLFFLCTFLNAQQTPVENSPQEVFDLSGDNPLTPLYNWSGNGGVIVAKNVFSAVSNPTDSLLVSGLPEGATIKQAYFSTSGWLSNPAAALAVFNGFQFAEDSAKVVDVGGSYFLSHFRWDVTSQISGNGFYTYSVSNISVCYLVYLVVVYEHATAPPVTIMINDGSESLQNDSTVTVFDSPAASGSGSLLVLTQASDFTNGPMEYLAFNGDTLAGPWDVFNASAGNFADQFIFKNLDVLEGSNMLEINTGDDWFGLHLAILSTGDITTSLQKPFSSVPRTHRLAQNYPNPFNPTTTIAYDVAGNVPVELTIFNSAGQEIRTLVRTNQPVGNYSVTWDGRSDRGEIVPSGLYFYRLRAGQSTLTRKMVLIR